jgi:type I restriction enzyme S subunit
MVRKSQAILKIISITAVIMVLLKLCLVFLWPFAASILIVLLLEPVVKIFTNLGISRKVGVFISLVLIGITIIFMSFYVSSYIYNQIIVIFHKLPEIMKIFSSKFKFINPGSDNYNEYVDAKDSDIPFIRTTDLINYEVDEFPDFYIPEEIYKELNQEVKVGDVLFTIDGKIGITGMITENDKVIVASGVSRLRLKHEAKKYNLTPEYLFLVLSLKETGLYPSIRRTVVASTIPHLREERLNEVEIPILDKDIIDEITKILKKAFELKNEKKKLIDEVRKEIDIYFGE